MFEMLQHLYKNIKGKESFKCLDHEQLKINHSVLANFGKKVQDLGLKEIRPIFGKTYCCPWLL